MKNDRQKEKQDKRAAALRENLKRRKAKEIKNTEGKNKA